MRDENQIGMEAFSYETSSRNVDRVKRLQDCRHRQGGAVQNSRRQSSLREESVQSAHFVADVGDCVIAPSFLQPKSIHGSRAFDSEQRTAVSPFPAPPAFPPATVGEQNTQDNAGVNVVVHGPHALPQASDRHLLV
jgi:hypothetical protein